MEFLLFISCFLLGMYATVKMDESYKQPEFSYEKAYKDVLKGFKEAIEIAKCLRAERDFLNTQIIEFSEKLKEWESKQ